MVAPFVLQDFDVGWVATDAVGQVALFTTGGPGPVPDSAMPSVENSEEFVLSLPEVSDADRVTARAGVNAFVEFAKRGSSRTTGQTFIAIHARP